jgi:glycerol-3-phosphate dehydrogenase
VLRFAVNRQWLARVAETSPVLAAEMAYASEHAMAMHVDDAIYRRTPVGAAGPPPDAVVSNAAAAMNPGRAMN